MAFSFLEVRSFQSEECASSAKRPWRWRDDTLSAAIRDASKGVFADGVRIQEAHTERKPPANVEKLKDRAKGSGTMSLTGLVAFAA
jgi:hypothetical protein